MTVAPSRRRTLGPLKLPLCKDRFIACAATQYPTSCAETHDGDMAIFQRAYASCVSEIPLRDDLRPLESALPQNSPITPLQSALPKTLDLNPFRIRTYKKTGGRG